MESQDRVLDFVAPSGKFPPDFNSAPTPEPNALDELQVVRSAWYPASSFCASEPVKADAAEGEFE